MTTVPPTHSTIRWDRGDDGVVILTLDDPSAAANTMTADYLASMDATITRLRAELDDITGVVITSAKKSFFAGGNLGDILAYRAEDAAHISATTTAVKAQFRALETLGRPVVAAIAGAALGGGLELALAAHHRIVADVRGAVLGFPEVTLGLAPGAGGIVRSVRMLGVQAAVATVLTTGTRFTPAEARELGLVDAVVETAAELLPAARAWIEANPDASQPWDRPGHSIPGGDPNDPGLASLLPTLPAALRKQLRGAPLPAPRAILAAAVEGAQVDFDTAMLIETRYFVFLATSTVAKNLITALFFNLQAVNAGASRPDGIPVRAVTRLGVLGAGMMGAGIAYVSAQAGIRVVLKDVSLEAAERGKAHSRKLVATAVERGRSTAEEGATLLALITPTAEDADLAGVDFIVEAVFESVAVKAEVLGRIQNVVAADAVLGSNTSTLPITALAENVDRAQNFIGVHFFSPVDRMPLLEIIVGAKTSDETLARAFDFGRQIGKTPIVVNDSRGFFTSRVILTFLNEAVAAVGEGIPAASVEQAGLQAGYPAGPLQLIDELTLTLPRRMREEAALADEKSEWADNGSAAVIDRLIDEFGRTGRAGGAGFYDYDESGRRTGLWPGLADVFGTVTGTGTETGTGTGSDPVVPLKVLQERMLFAEATEAVRCLDEGVLRSVADANVGSILGIGYPAWTGGVLQYINSYPGGLAGFVTRSDELGQRYGDHLRAPESLRARAKTGRPYS